MRFILKQGVLEEIQFKLKMNDQEFADYIGMSRSSLWRARLPINDRRYSLGQDVIAKILNKFPEKTFEDLFILDQLYHECDNNNERKKEVV